MFKGREMAYTELGAELLNRFIERIDDVSKVESPLKVGRKKYERYFSPGKS